MSEEHTGGSVNYYRVTIVDPTSLDIKPYIAECNDIIEVLEMTPAMANIFKAVWRMAASLKGKKKKGLTLKYDAEKTVFFSRRLLYWAIKLEESNNLEKKECLTTEQSLDIVSSLPARKLGVCMHPEVCNYPKCSCNIL